MKKDGGRRTEDGGKKLRRMVGLAPEVYDRMQVLAQRRDRSLAREVGRVLVEELKREGLWNEGGRR